MIYSFCLHAQRSLIRRGYQIKGIYLKTTQLMQFYSLEHFFSKFIASTCTENIKHKISFILKDYSYIILKDYSYIINNNIVYNDRISVNQSPNSHFQFNRIIFGDFRL